jgi:hypothetical protein
LGGLLEKESAPMKHDLRHCDDPDCTTGRIMGKCQVCGQEPVTSDAECFGPYNTIRGKAEDVLKTAKVLTQIACPFCKGQVACVECDDGRLGVLHDEPTCKQFDDLGPIEFLRAVRKIVAPETFS